MDAAIQRLAVLAEANGASVDAAEDHFSGECRRIALAGPSDLPQTVDPLEDGTT